MENEICHLKLEEIIPKNNIPHDKINDYLHDNFIQSVKKHGIIQPIVVTKNNDKYEIIDGNRRYFAALKVGLDKIPSLVRHDRENTIKLELRDNIDDSNLSPIEEAKKYREILDTSSITQEQLAQSIGKSQSALANKLRLLNLPIEIQEALNKFEISERHARSLLTVKNSELQIKLLKKIKDEKLTVRELDSEIKNMSNMFIPEEYSNKNNNNQNDMFNSINNGTSQASNMFVPNNNAMLNNIDYGNNDINSTQNSFGSSFNNNTVNQNNDMNQYILPDTNGGMNPFFTSNDYVAPTFNNTLGGVNDNSSLNQPNPFSSIRMNTNSLNNSQPLSVDENNRDNTFDINDYKLPEYENNSDISNDTNSMQINSSPTSFEPTSIEPSTEYKYVEDNPNYVSVDNPKGVSSVDDVIEILRSSLDKIKNGKIKVDTEEIDYDDTYQITIRIDKKGDFL